MAKGWFVVHTYSGYEAKVKIALENRIKALHLETYFEEILLPSEQVLRNIKGKSKTATRKIFPGYIFVKMELNEDTWRAVKNTPKVTGFVGGREPSPISGEELDRIARQIKEGVEKPKPMVTFEKGETVRVIEGPFTNFNGIVNDVNLEKGKLQLLIPIFGRQTPLELSFIQVEKA